MTGEQLVRSYKEWSEPIFADGALSRKEKELIAMAVAIAVAGRGCVDEHRGYAIDLGATEAEVVEAIGVVMSIMACGAVAAHTDLFH
ncbi:MAG: carboxymuconolactone decarboxylase family protein [Anaerolineae bacterium]|nr:carboxymuconolactone decarboxylase family protein [Anaerolineae bacterium]NIN97824.1 carboxymuconolactone decarboxylase family protein [Anaerolineae bacterium]NIQ80822.1 carboxymuconolactone decarboxylase family protein [Anaerolineae bacterium]